MFSRKGRFFLSILFALFFFLPCASWAGDFDFIKDLRSSVSIPINSQNLNKAFSSGVSSVSRTMNNYLPGVSGQISSARNMLSGAIPSAAAVPGLLSNAVIGAAGIAQRLPAELPARVDAFQKGVSRDATCFGTGVKIDVLASDLMPYEIKRDGLGEVSIYQRDNSDQGIKKFILNKVGSNTNLVHEGNKKAWNDHNILVLEKNRGQNQEVVQSIDNAFEVIPQEHKSSQDMLVASIEPMSGDKAGKYDQITSVIQINENNSRDPSFNEYTKNGLTSHERNVFHEYAHFLIFNNRVPPQITGKFDEAFRQGYGYENSFARPYGQESVHEDFATMYEQYLSDSSVLMDPEKYKAMAIKRFALDNPGMFPEVMKLGLFENATPNIVLNNKTALIAQYVSPNKPGTEGAITYTFAMGNNGITRNEVPLSQFTNSGVLANKFQAFGGGGSGVRSYNEK